MNKLVDGMKVKALKTLQNIIIAGEIYDVKTLREEISCINVEDTNWFEPYIESAFKIGDLVAFTIDNGKKVTESGRKLTVDSSQIYKVIEIRPKALSVIPRKNSKNIVPEYTIENEFGHRFFVYDSSITKIPIYYVLSFSDKDIAIHQINEITFNKKYKDKAKSMFVFNTLEDAEEAKKYFENYHKNRKHVIG